VGIALARAVRDALQKNIDQFGNAPKVIYFQNHGMLALGRTAKEIENVTAMAVKNARTMAQTFSLGGPHFLDDNAVARIDKRPDEIVRRAKFEGRE
jgi:ribulose-5-phosphate 4-epimerase/fuculose-1-phosphate aldolase